ncbi:MAG: type II toxin-antitoxin system RelE family toxin [Nitrospiraceae bacterium]
MASVRSVNFSERVGKTLQAIDPRAREYLKEAIREIAADPFLGRKLKGEFEGLRCHRVGSLRIVYRAAHGFVEAVYLDSQKGLYR